MILKYYGGYENIEYLRNISNTDKNGTNAYDLIKTSQKIGFESYGVRLKEEEYKNLQLPCIAHVIINKVYKHFVVIYKYENNKFLVGDPVSKLKWIDESDFNLITTNVFIFLKPKEINYKKKPSIAEFIISTIIINKKAIIYIFIFSLLNVIFTTIYSFHFQFFVNTDSILFMSYILINIYLIKVYAEYFKNKISIILGKCIESKIVNEEYKNILNLPYKYFSNQTTGEIVSKLNDLESLKNIIIKLIIVLLIDTILSLILIIVMFKINIMLSIITLLTAFSYIIITKLYSNIFINKIYEYYENKVNYNSYLVESIASYETIKGLSVEENIYNKFYEKKRLYLNKSIEIEKIYNQYNFIKELIYNMVLIILLSLSMYEFKNGNMSLSLIITFNFLFLNFINPIKDFLEIFLSYKEGNIIINRLFKKTDNSSKLKFKLKGNIDIKNLSYKYKKDIILNDINMNIKSKEKILLTGISGSGKSTLLKMIKGYIKESGLNIKLDNIILDNLDDEVFKQVVYVSQNENLFTDTVLNNIVLNRNIKEEKIKQVIELFDIDLNYFIEENGKNISGGERQKIILARTLLTECTIYLLDESFSQMDIQSERIILKKLFSYLKNKTIIVVSHRFDNSDLFDKQYDIKKGEILN